MDLEDNLIPNLTSLLADTKKKKRKRSTSKQETEKLNKSKRDKSRVAGISEMMGKRPHMEDTVSSHLAFSGIDGTYSYMHNFFSPSKDFKKKPII